MNEYKEKIILPLDRYSTIPFKFKYHLLKPIEMMKQISR